LQRKIANEFQYCAASVDSCTGTVLFGHQCSLLRCFRCFVLRCFALCCVALRCVAVQYYMHGGTDRVVHGGGEERGTATGEMQQKKKKKSNSEKLREIIFEASTVVECDSISIFIGFLQNVNRLFRYNKGYVLFRIKHYSSPTLGISNAPMHPILSRSCSLLLRLLYLRFSSCILFHFFGSSFIWLTLPFLCNNLQWLPRFRILHYPRQLGCCMGYLEIRNGPLQDGYQPP
jgi:hypothetical protein